jgi:putative oxidoreductase
MLQAYPFVSLRHALAVARIATALFFMAHAIGRIVLGTIPQFGKFMGSIGFPAPELWVWAITLTEIICGTLLILNRYVRFAALPLFTIAAVGILLIHRHLGWWVGEHGTGGSEYSVALMVLLVVIAAADKDRA